MTGQSFKRRVRERQHVAGISYSEALRLEKEFRRLDRGIQYLTSWNDADAINVRLEAAEVVRKLQTRLPVTDPVEMLSLANLAFLERNMEQAIFWDQQAGEAGAAEGYCRLAEYALFGTDPLQALRWWKRHMLALIFTS